MNSLWTCCSSGFFFVFPVFASLPLQVCGSVAHTDQEDMSSVQTAGHPEQPGTLRVRFWGGDQRTWRRRRNRRRYRLWAHPSPSTFQPWIAIGQPGGVRGHHHHCPVPRLPRTPWLTYLWLWRLLLPRGGHRLREWRRWRAPPHWWWHRWVNW